MAWKRDVMEAIVTLVGKTQPQTQHPPTSPNSIFVLRNNDLGDLLVVTPLFEALHQQFPQARIVAGVGSWNLETLKFSPFLAEVITVNAPWHNKFMPKQGVGEAFRYIAFSEESRKLADEKFDVGIDVLGSQFGSLLMLRAGIPYRLGVRGYAGGHSVTQQFVEFNEYEHVGRSALRFAELLGATKLPPNRPQIFLSSEEQRHGEQVWSARTGQKNPIRIVIGPGGGFVEKCWPLASFVSLMPLLETLGNIEVIVVGSAKDQAAGAKLAAASSTVRNLAGQFQLRETFAVVAAADLVICNSSMLMHVAAAFAIPTIVLLGEWITDAKQHAAQWGYAGNYRVLGKDGDRTTLYTAPEIITIIPEMLST